jgi:hypothetical protein
MSAGWRILAFASVSGLADPSVAESDGRALVSK